MKKLTTIILIGLLISSFGALGQLIDDSVFAKNAITTYPLNYFSAGEINLGYEHVINNKESYEIILAWNFADWSFAYSGSGGNTSSSSTGLLKPLQLIEEGGAPSLIPSIGGSVRFNYRFYFTDNKPMPLGAYFGPQFMFKHTNFNNLYKCDEYYCDSLNISKNAITLKVLLGYQSRIFKRGLINYYIGAGFRYQAEKATRYYRKRWYDNPNDFTEDTDKITNRLNILTPTFHLGVSVGYFF